MTHDELNAALTLQRKIDRLQARLDDLRQTGGVGGTGTNTPVQGGSGVFVGQIIAELEVEIASLKQKLIIEKEIIRRYIEKLDLDVIECKLMVLRYVECRPWRLVGASMGYAERQTYRIHESALNVAANGSQ